MAIQDNKVLLDFKVCRVTPVNQDKKEHVDSLVLQAHLDSLDLRARLESQDHRDLMEKEGLMVHLVLLDLQARLAVQVQLEIQEPLAVLVLLVVRVHRVWSDSLEQLENLVFKDSQDFQVGFIVTFQVNDNIEVCVRL